MRRIEGSDWTAGGLILSYSFSSRVVQRSNELANTGLLQIYSLGPILCCPGDMTDGHAEVVFFNMASISRRYSNQKI